MPLSISWREEENVSGLVADRRLYLAADGVTVVDGDDPRAASLLAAAGRTIPDDVCDRLGLEKDDGVIVQKMRRPAENKMVSPAENKSYPLHVGGGWYELSNGEKVQGKAEAEAAEAELSG